MTVAIVCLLGILAILAAAQLVRGLANDHRRQPAIDGYVGQTIALHLLSGKSMRGVLVDAAPDAVILARAEHLGSVVVALDGRQVVPRDRIDFFQAMLSTKAAGE
jgi:hypothetical protein